MMFAFDESYEFTSFGHPLFEELLGTDSPIRHHFSDGPSVQLFKHSARGVSWGTGLV